MMSWSRNARSLRCRAGTSFDRAELAVGADDALNQDSETELSLSENVTLDPASRRAHPSGTLKRRCPLAAWNGTNTVLSGMSPGGLLSAETGCSVDAGCGAEAPAAGVLTAWGRGAGAGAAREAPQPARGLTAVARTGAARRPGPDPPRSLPGSFACPGSTR